MRLLDGGPLAEEPRRDGFSTEKISVAAQVCARGHCALKLLYDATIFSRDVNHIIWDFAVEIGVLNENGLTHTDLRWLIFSGYVETAVEMRSNGDGRCFQHEGALRLSRNSCFVLTSAGVEFVRSALFSSETVSAGTPPPQPSNGLQIAAVTNVIVKPIWDRDRQELRVGDQLVKQFKVPAPNQEMVLAAFHEENWPVRIDDPLPPQPDLEPKRRLHDTIVSLNRNHKANLIRFQGDGSGQGVRWELKSG